MDFRLNEEQQMLQDTVARLVRGEYSFEKRLEYSESDLGFSEDFWKQLGELGLTAVPGEPPVDHIGGHTGHRMVHRHICPAVGQVAVAGLAGQVPVGRLVELFQFVGVELAVGLAV